MLTNGIKTIERVLTELCNSIEIPDSAYEKACHRYESIGTWLSRDASSVIKNSPHIFPQGSFRLGTVIRPLNDNEEYDLDLACELRLGITKKTHSQKAVKELIGNELESYRQAKNIEKKLEGKHRCWRLEYRDNLCFHMDIVPCIPGDKSIKEVISRDLKRFLIDDDLSKRIVDAAVSITDDRSPDYEQITDDWHISNPIGYAHWFKSRMLQRGTELQTFGESQIDDVPLFKQKKPLQRAIQIFKRHRDFWSRKNPELKPISIIITTLAARAYNGEKDLFSTITNILEKMGNLVNNCKPRVPNPVNPEEDFADKWYTASDGEILEQNFWNWLHQIKRDFDFLLTAENVLQIDEGLKTSFGIEIPHAILVEAVKDFTPVKNQNFHKVEIIDKKQSVQPWGNI